MGLAVVLVALTLGGVQILMYLTNLYNVHIFDRFSQDMQALVNSDLEFDYIIGKCGRLSISRAHMSPL